MVTKSASRLAFSCAASSSPRRNTTRISAPISGQEGDEREQASSITAPPRRRTR